MKYIVDRIEEGIAILEKEDLTHVEAKLSELPLGIREGSVLIFDGNTYTVDTDVEAQRKKRIYEKQHMLFKKMKKD